MKLFAIDPYVELGHAVARQTGLDIATPFEFGRFRNSELRLKLGCSVAGEHCVVLGTVEPPELNLARFTLICHTLRHEGAAMIEAVLPYLAYSRQDKPEPGRSLGAQWIGDLLGACGVGAVHALDVHSGNVTHLFPIPLNSISPVQVFARELRARMGPEWTLVAPDEGAVERCQALARAIGRPLSVVHFEKTRTEKGVTSRLCGHVTERALVFDDILDTGGTLLACCEGLRAAGAKEVLVAVTHGLFTGTSWRVLLDRGVSLILCTDSVAPARCSDPRIRVLSCSRLLAENCPFTEKKRYVES